MSVMLFNEIKELIYTDEMFHTHLGIHELDQDTVDMIVAYAPNHCEELRAKLARQYYDESLDRLYTEYVADLGRLSVLAMIAMLRSPRHEALSPHCGDLIQEIANRLAYVFKEHKKNAPSELEFTLHVEGHTSTNPSLVLAVQGGWSMVSVCDLSSITESDIQHLWSKGVDGLILTLINELLAETVLNTLGTRGAEISSAEIIIHPTPIMFLKVPQRLVGDPIVISGLSRLRNQFIEFSKKKVVLNEN